MRTSHSLLAGVHYLTDHPRSVSSHLVAITSILRDSREREDREDQKSRLPRRFFLAFLMSTLSFKNTPEVAVVLTTRGTVTPQQLAGRRHSSAKS